MLWLTFFIHHYHKTIYFRVAICFKFLFKQQFVECRLRFPLEDLFVQKENVDCRRGEGEMENVSHIANSSMHLQRGLRFKDLWLQRTLDKLIYSRLRRQLGVVLSLLLDECPSFSPRISL